MSIGWDVAELLAEIDRLKATVVRQAPNGFTEAELQLTVDAIRELHTPDRLGHEMRPVAASVLTKLGLALKRIENERKTATEFAASLTEDERQLILNERTKRRGGG